ncbi:phage terminase small subunit P27 family [Tardiphaga sp. vice278]|uniref:phage terminase small subunit P27 family n=1 Tax=Tardiphaga sp. vice278 TaxID=2592815 RepID=UPI0011638CC5|nr:phage terminase small subunit P27 family [Tardiphaga sp. vice278]QDM17672.1 phage terminase small subunit P27 family [Tardiphaga sp. vice278]
MRGVKPAIVVAGTIYQTPAAPAWLSRLGRAEWKKVATILVERRHLTDADLGTLAAYADAVGQLAESTQIVNREGMVIETRAGLRKHPAISIQMNARNQIRQLAAELGLTPVSRSRPSIRDDGGDDAGYISPMDL